MTKQEAADRLGVTTRAVENYTRKGRLSVSYSKGKRGQIALFSEAEVNRLKDELAQPGYPQRPAIERPEKPGALAVVPFGASGLMPISPAAPVEAYRRFVPVADKLMLSLDEAAALAGLSRGHLREAIRGRKLKGKIIGKGWRIKRADLEAYINKL